MGRRRTARPTGDKEVASPRSPVAYSAHQPVTGSTTAARRGGAPATWPFEGTVLRGAPNPEQGKTMVSKMITDRSKSVSFVTTALTTHEARLAKRIGAELAPFLDGEGVDIRPLVRVLTRSTEHRLSALQEADDRHEAELADDPKVRDERDEAAPVLRQAILGARDAIHAGWGPLGLRAFGITGETPSDPYVLDSLARQLVAALEDEKLPLPAPRPGVTVDRAALATQITSAAAAFTEALRAVRREETEAQTTQTAKWAALEANDDGFSRAMGVISSLFRLARMDYEATRLTPPTRTPGELSDPETPLDGRPEEEPTA